MKRIRKSLSIITYHYIKKTNNKNKGLKFLNVKAFINQLDYLKKNYKILEPEEAKYLLKKKKSFKRNYCWLTFDDGYKEHYDIAFQELEKRNLKASFFPVVTSVKEKQVLEVNKIQFILAKLNKDIILQEIEDYYKKNFPNKLTFSKFIKSIDLWTRNLINKGFPVFDDKKTILIKKLLQRALPIKDRTYLTNYFFKKYLKRDNSLDYKKIYLTTNNLKEMYKRGHEIGIHSYDHQHLDSLSEKKQKFQINSSIKFLKDNNLMINNLTMNYPYGSNDSTTRKIVKRNKYIQFGLTTVKGIISSNNNNLLILPRIDTQDV